MKYCSTYNFTLFTVDSASWVRSTFRPMRSTWGLSQWISGGGAVLAKARRKGIERAGNVAVKFWRDGWECCRRVLWGSVVAECQREKCWREKCCIWSLVAECWGKDPCQSLRRSVVQTCWNGVFQRSVAKEHSRIQKSLQRSVVGKRIWMNGRAPNSTKPCPAEAALQSLQVLQAMRCLASLTEGLCRPSDLMQTETHKIN